ncbi:membrane-bound lytic murein transglycosylase B [Litorivivens lipolytica]|uniref:Membrane-bound lytic murein transglycosylase B n=1 Tax=Litorivivens lipolytica TaxID=1524264 RepID=A0A7W4W490_9GAMM|nr:lytic murein transglycosylase B [Litorivivens lipolytica]MBB3047185.1 membrane-bound lytic murein transglycosylase B [Litorivivens lipolytica]
MRKALMSLVLFLSLPAAAWASYLDHEQAKAFTDRMVTEHGFERAQVEKLLAQAERKQSILDAISRPAERTLEWKDYRKIFIQDSRIDQGVEFWREHRATLERAYKQYGVPPQIIVAIIGVETRYGRHKGNYRVLDALATLGFDYPRRAKFFSKQLEEYLLMTREQGLDPLELKGSYAGAMGFGQFIPSSYRAYAVDFDGDGVVDIVNNPVDAIGSVANYFARHHWRNGEAVTLAAEVTEQHDPEVFEAGLKPKWTVAELAKKGVRSYAKLDGDDMATAIRFIGDEGVEYWLGLDNFYVITRYNHSSMYAMAVYQLSQLVAQRNAQ